MDGETLRHVPRVVTSVVGGPGPRVCGTFMRVDPVCGFEGLVGQVLMETSLLAQFRSRRPSP